MTTASPFTVGLIQMACSGSPDENLARALEKVAEAAAAGAQIICLPELFRTPYFCQAEDSANFDLAETLPGPTTDALAQAAREREVAIIAPVFERRTAGLYHNSVAVIDLDGQVIGTYRKMHIPDDPNYYEKFYFTPGDLGFKAFDTSVAKVGTLICWDQWYPEAARLTALQGADILIYPTAIGWHPGEKEEFGDEQFDAWRTVQRGHAISNGTYVAAVNRLGLEQPHPDSPGIEFWGGSFICDPFGVVLAEASHDQEEILLANVDPQRIEDVRHGWPFLRDRRIDAYEGLTKRFLDEG